MTDTWGALAAASALGLLGPVDPPSSVPVLTAPLSESRTQEPTTEAIDNVLVIEWRHKQIRPTDGALIFTGGVTARYGPTTVRSDRMVIYQTDKRKQGLAEGNVVLEDPDGRATADRLEFDWLAQTGSGSNVTVAVEGLWLHAETLQIQPNQWTLANVKAAPDGSRRPLFGLSSPRVVFRPGAGGNARNAAISILGTKLVTVPSYRFGGRQNGDGIRLPSISYSQGLGVAWRSSYLFDDRTRLSGGFRAKRHERTGASIELTRSLLPRNEPGTLIPPQSDFNERFFFGYFDSIYNRRPSEERSFMGTRRSSVSIGAAANQTVPARFSEQQHTKPFDLVFEEARNVAAIDMLANLRYQSLQEEGGLNERRIILSSAIMPPDIKLGERLYTHLRLDGSAYWGDNRYGWAQAQAGLIYHASPKFRLGAAFVQATSTGTPTFAIDRLFSARAFHGRVDMDFGHLKVNYLAKYDFDRRKWYDNEFWVSTVLGPVEPFVTFREFPRTISFGVRLRAEQAFDRLRRRLEGGTPNKVEIDRP